jgi:hypothetical protein
MAYSESDTIATFFPLMTSDSMIEYACIIAVNSAVLFVCLPSIRCDRLRGSLTPKKNTMLTEKTLTI